ncbi:extended synaptotagmin-2 isoform X2 [Coregonus clupeaformis]|uniref:extended synaptotagmin-2 isoform X2 n=1 Tax=Coregonus clupeaformis TaxID=59861 RepID=UPI001BDFF40F|nr:extended synaptotagmin-2 isoform X2 [Coregonus clupeaformis]
MRRAAATSSGAQGADSGKTTSTGPTIAKENGPTTPSPPVSPTTPIAPVDLEDEPQSSVTDATQMWMKFAKTFIVIFPIYVLGYFEFSFSWVLIGLAIFFWWRRNQGHKNNRLTRALAFLEHEEKTVKLNLATSEMPPWVHFPDVERVEWLNKTVKQMWPYICQFVDKLFRETIEPAVKGANAHLSSFCFTKIDMGDKPLRVNGVKVYTENVDKRQIIMDLEISFVGNTEIDVDIKKYYCRAGIKSIQVNCISLESLSHWLQDCQGGIVANPLCNGWLQRLHGVLRVVMEPLLGDMPLIGALSVFFLKKPLLDINWTGLTNMLDIPGLNGLCDNLIQDIIYSYLVLPNRITIPLVGEAQLAQLRFPIPKGVLRIHFLEAQDLLGKDKFLGGLIKGKSDPYGVLHIGNQLFQSKVVKENIHPKWNEVYEAMVYEQSGPQNLEIELFDEDTDQDDFLGSLLIDVAELQKEQKVDEWFVMEEVNTGKLHLKLEWLSLLPTPEKLDQVLTSIKADKGQANDGLSSALLVVYLDSARNLPSVFEGNLGSGHLKERRASGLVFCENTASLYRTLFSGKKVSSVPSPFVQFTVGHKTYESKTRYKTNEPVWEEVFTFLIHNPKCQELEAEVKDEKHECSLGTLNLPLVRLLEAEDMTLYQHFPLKNSGPSCTLKIKIALRVLCLEKLIASDQTSSVQVRKASTSNPIPMKRPSVSEPPNPVLDLPSSVDASTQELHRRGGDCEPYSGGPVGIGLADAGRSTSNLAISGSQKHLAHRGSTPSIASDISNPYATQELQQRLRELQNGSASHFPLGEVQLTVRHSSQRNKLIVVVHACRNLIVFTDHLSDPYVRLYLLPDKRRSGRRKTHTHKKTLNPVFDQIFEFSVSIVELHRRTLDVAVKNGGNIFSKHKGLLGKVLVDLTYEDIAKGWTQWYELSEDGLKKPLQQL